MLHIWHSGCFMKPTHKWYFWPFLYPKIAFFVIFAQICPKIVIIWTVDITFFVFVVSRDWRYMLEDYYTFKKIKKFWSWTTSVGSVHPSKSKTMKKKKFFSWFSIFRIVQVLLKLANFKKCFFFWKDNSNPLTCIFNLARRQIQKKFLSTVQIITIFGHIWAKMTKNAIFGHKNDQKYHFQAGFMKQPLCQMWSICTSEFSEKTFFEVGQLHYPL